MNFYIIGNHWIRCEIVNRLTGMVRLYTGETRRGKIRQGMYGWLVEAQ